MDSTSPRAEQKKAETEHPIAAAIDKLVHNARDIKMAARSYVPLAIRTKRRIIESSFADLKRCTADMKSSANSTKILAVKGAHDAALRLDRAMRSRVPNVLETGLFMSLFSRFDAFTGDLLKAVYRRRPELFKSLNHTLTFGDILAAESLEYVKEQVLDSEIESLRRKSFSEQFTTLSQRFEIKLTDFARWPDFIEAAQRRNLLTHCDGIVSEQYLHACREAGYKKSLPPLNKRIGLGNDYFQDACDLVIEVGVKLGQTLWRKALPYELEDADKHLGGLLYQSLQNESWDRAKMVGKFAFDQRRLSSEVQRRMMIVNYAQALRRAGEKTEATKLLASFDWTASAPDFKLAHALLTDDFDRAAHLMTTIGKQGELVKEESYHLCPLFTEFRETDLFRNAYEKVFGYAFATKALADATEASKSATEQLKIDRRDSALESEIGDNPKPLRANEVQNKGYKAASEGDAPRLSKLEQDRDDRSGEHLEGLLP